MSLLLQAVLAAFVVSLVAFSGAVLFIWQEKRVQKFLILFVALAAGTLLGTAFLHLLPEAIAIQQEGSVLHIEHVDHDLHDEHHEHHEYHDADDHDQKPHTEQHHVLWPAYAMLLGILAFYLLEKFIHWHHHHDMDCRHHPVTTLSLVGDGLHNFIDGCLIGFAFAIDVSVGIVSTLAIVLHEIPQEIGDLSILLHHGFSKARALFWNFFSAVFAIVGAVFAVMFAQLVSSYLPALLGFVAGVFVYIALADIIPELHSRKYSVSRGAVSFSFFLGLFLIWLLLLVLPH